MLGKCFLKVRGFLLHCGYKVNNTIFGVIPLLDLLLFLQYALLKINL